MNNKRQRNKLFTMLLLVMAWFIPQWGWAQSHIYNNGFCTDEDCSEKYEPAAKRNGWYEISNAGQLYWFAEQVDNGNTNLINANVRLTNDIIDNDVTFSYDAENNYAPIATDANGKNVDVNTLRVWKPIGKQEGIISENGAGKKADENYPEKQKWFGGHFDGNNFSILGLYFNDSETLGGLFAFLRYTSKIENVRIRNSYFKGKAVGSIAAHLEGGTVNNCHNNSFLIGDFSAGGILAEACARFWTESESTFLVKVSNCVNEGLVVGKSAGAAGIVQFAYQGSGNYLWLINMGICKSIAIDNPAGEIIGESQSSGASDYLKFCYGYGANKVLIGTNSGRAKITNSAIVSEESTHTGKMAYLLSQIDSKWGQNLNDGSKDFPEYESEKVYKLCGENYTNDATKKAAHNWKNGICSTCGDKQPAIFNDNTNCYEIENYGQLIWFDERFGFGSPKEKETINAILTADITIDKTDKNNNILGEWMSLGDACCFNGQGHTIYGFCANNGNVFCNGSVKNLNLVNATVKCNRNIKIGGIASSTEKPIMNCSFKGDIIGYQVGGIAAYTNSTISKCSFEGSIQMEKILPDGLTSIKGHIGGLVMNLGSKGNINNCSFVGKCVGNNSQDNTLNTLIGGLVEENNEGKVSNCFVSATFSDFENGDNNGKYYYIVPKNNGNINRIAYDSEKNSTSFLVNNETASGTSQDISGFKTKKIISGEVTYWLNIGNTNGTQAWYQKLDESGNKYPILNNNGNNTVYYGKKCDSQTDIYVNNNTVFDENGIMPHKFELTSQADSYCLYSGICTMCQTTEPATKYIKDFGGIGENLKLSVEADGSYLATDIVTINDANGYDSPVDFTAQKLEYTRKYLGDNKWQAVYVPFETLATDWIDNGITVASINNFHEYEKEDGSGYETVLEVKKATSGVFEANTPYVVRSGESGGENKTITLNNVKLYKAESKTYDCMSMTRKYDFTGIYNSRSGLGQDESAAVYALNKQGRIAPLKSETTLGAQRWYLTVSDRNGSILPQDTKSRTIRIDMIGEGATTGIKDVQVITCNETDNIAKAGIYDLQGRKLSKEPTHGIYIKNGKKYVK